MAEISELSYGFTALRSQETNNKQSYLIKPAMDPLLRLGWRSRCGRRRSLDNLRCNTVNLERVVLPAETLALIAEEIKLHSRNASDDVEMNCEIWSTLPEELLLHILARLPTLSGGRLGIVCKQWKHLFSPSQTFQRISSTVGPRSWPAFLLGGQRLIHMTHSSIKELYLLQLQSPSTSPLCKISADCLPPDSVHVVAACKSLICCYKAKAHNVFYICNPVTRTWKTLPPSVDLKCRSFTGLAFDTCTKTCVLLAGSVQMMRGENKMHMEIYSSKTDAWTKLQMLNIPSSIYPSGEGVYSRGRFYWINMTAIEYENRARYRIDVVAFNVANQRWNVIRNPDTSVFHHVSHWKLTGYDGKVVLVHQKDISLWQLSEDQNKGIERYMWSKLRAFPRSVYEEVLLDEREKSSTELLRRYMHTQIVINSFGWVLLYLPRNKLVVFDSEGRSIQRIEGRILTIMEEARLFPVNAYEVNNVWWPE